MRIKVLFFAHLADLAGSREIEMDTGASGSVADVVENLSRLNPRISDSIACCRIAINAEWAELNDKLCDGDELAFVPPVSGG